MDNFTTPSYDLEQIKKAFSKAENLRRTKKVNQDILDLCFTDQDVVNAIQSLSSDDFYKSMSPEHSGFIAWHDVYKPRFNNVNLYIKFQINNNKEFIVSFKRNKS